MLNLKQSLKEDLWNSINKEDVQSRKIEDFIFFIFYLLLERNDFNMSEVYKTSEEIMTKYNNILEESKDIAIMNDPIKAINYMSEKFNEEIIPLVETIR